MGKRHKYIYNSTRKSIKNKHTFFILWKLYQFRNALSTLSSSATNRLNDCGWMFMQGSYEHKIYQCRQRSDELERLICYSEKLLREIDKKDEVVPNDIQNYALSLMKQSILLFEESRSNCYGIWPYKIINLQRMQNAVSKFTIHINK